MNLPLSAVIGQSEALLALQLAAIDPSLGGVLLRGPRGTAKSTMARGLAAWIGDAPFVDLPLGADEDKLVGSIDLQAVLSDQTVRAEAGLLARAHGGVLYADEVNLLPDHLVDLLLDAAASGSVRVEREGVSRRFDARFVLVGTMNPDEGELRPQLLDRFGLCVDVATPVDPSERAAVLRQRVHAVSDSAAFAAQYADAEAQAREALIAARKQLPLVDCDAALEQIAVDCAHSGADGLRGDLSWLAAARAHAALYSRSEVCDADLDATRAMAMRHRVPDDPPEPPRGRRPDSTRNADQQPTRDSASSTRSTAQTGAVQRADSASGAGWAGQSKARDDRSGAMRLVSVGRSVAWARSLARQGGAPAATDELAFRSRRRRQGGAWVVLLDCSASMVRKGILARTQGAVMSLLQRAYWQRRPVAVLRFAGDQVETLHPLGRPPQDPAALVRVVTAGGATPLAEGLCAAAETLRRAPGQLSDMQLWLFTDGRVSHANLVAPACRVVVVDTEAHRSGDARRLAAHLDAELVALGDVESQAA